MDEAAEKAVIKKRVRAISKGSGLQRRALAASLGKGLCLLWEFDPEVTDLETRREIARRFDRIIRSTPDESDDSWVVRSGLLSFNISTLTNGEHLSYSARKQFLDRPWRKKEGRPEPDVGYRSKGSVITATEKVYAHMAEVIWAEWKQTFPNEPFPRDLPPQTTDDTLEEEAGLDVVDTGEGLPVQAPLQSGTEDVLAAPSGSSPGRRKPITVAVAAVVVVVGVTALFVFHPWSSPQTQSDSEPPSGPLALTITSLQSRLDGYSLAFPAGVASKAITVESEYQNATGNLQPAFEQALQSGAYSFGSEVLNLQATTDSSDQLVITGIHAINIKRGPVATGTVINNPGGAGGGPNIGFDLDQPTPDARNDSNGTLGEPYFQAQLLSVTRSSATALELEFIGHGASYSFNVEIDYLDGQTKRSLILPNAADGGQPFVGRVSGTLCDHPPNLSPTALAQFNTLQYGHIMEPVGNADGTRSMQSMSSADFKAGSCG